MLSSLCCGLLKGARCLFFCHYQTVGFIISPNIKDPSPSQTHKALHLLNKLTVYSAVLQFIYAADVFILDLILRFPLVLKTTESVTREMMKRTFLK